MVGVTSKLGVMFPESTFGQANTNFLIPWNVRSSMAGIVDGASSTILMAENTLTGFSAYAHAYSAKLAHKLGLPIPQLHVVHRRLAPLRQQAAHVPTVLSIAPTASLCPITAPTVPAGRSPMSPDSRVVSMAVEQLTIEGSYPYPNSAHPGGCNMAFCDGGARFIRSTIDGTVYSKLLTPAGSNLPPAVRQLPVDQDAFAQ